jgi:uncharacterized membrane protein
LDSLQVFIIAGAALIPAVVAAFLAYRFRVRNIIDMDVEMTPLRWAMMALSTTIIVVVLGYKLIVGL